MLTLVGAIAIDTAGVVEYVMLSNSRYQPFVNFTVTTVAGFTKFVAMSAAAPLVNVRAIVSPASVEIVSAPLPELVPAFKLTSTDGVVKLNVACVT